MADSSRRGRFSHYDPVEDVIWTDLTGVEAHTTEIIDEVFDELIALARTRPGRYVVSCWKDVHLADAVVVSHFGRRSVELLKFARGVVRYHVTDPLTRSALRTESIKHRAQGTKSNLYGSKEEALAVAVALRGKPVASEVPSRPSTRPEPPSGRSVPPEAPSRPPRDSVIPVSSTRGFQNPERR